MKRLKEGTLNFHLEQEFCLCVAGFPPSPHTIVLLYQNYYFIWFRLFRCYLTEVDARDMDLMANEWLKFKKNIHVLLCKYKIATSNTDTSSIIAYLSRKKWWFFFPYSNSWKQMCLFFYHRTNLPWKNSEFKSELFLRDIQWNTQTLFLILLRQKV